MALARRAALTPRLCVRVYCGLVILYAFVVFILGRCASWGISVLFLYKVIAFACCGQCGSVIGLLIWCRRYTLCEFLLMVCWCVLRTWMLLG